MSFANFLLKGYQEPSKFTDLLFSEANLKNVANQIVYNNYLETKKSIKTPDLMKVGEHLRNVYLNYGQFTETKNIKKEIKRLNDATIASLMPYIISDTKDYYENLIEFSNPNGVYIPETSINPSITGTKLSRSPADILLGDDFFKIAKILNQN